MRLDMRKILFLLAALLAGCATTKTPTATNLTDSSAMTVSVKKALGWPVYRDAELTVTDPKTGETFSGRIPGTKPEPIAIGEIDTWPLPDESVGMLKGNKGGVLVCKFRPRTGTGTCMTPSNAMVYVDF